MAVLGKSRLLDALARPELERRLIVTPILHKDQIGVGSIDVSLGNEFRFIERGNLSCVDLDRARERSRSHHVCKQIARKESFYLHPRQLVIASTLEYFRLPDDLAGEVTSRSSFGRAGLVIATATAVHPGFTGAITLELVNLGEVPLRLRPGLRIAQIVLHTCEGGSAYSGRFSYHAGAEEFRAETNSDREFWSDDEGD